MDYSNMTVNQAMVDDLVFEHEQEFAQEKIHHKSDMKKLKFAAEKRVCRSNWKEFANGMLTRHQVEETAIRMRYQECLHELQNKQELELGTLTDPDEIEACKARQQDEINIFTGRDDIVLKAKQQKESAELASKQKEELASLTATYDEKIAALPEGEEKDALVAEKKNALADLNRAQIHESANCVVNQKRDMTATHHYKQKQRSHKSSLRRNRIIVNTTIYIVLVILSLVWLSPFVLLVLQSFRNEVGSGGEIVRSMSGYVFTFNDDGSPALGWDNYIYLFTEETGFWRWYLNTFIIAVVVAAGVTVMTILTAYGLSRLRFRGRKLIMNLMLVLGMFPGFLTMIVLYWLLSWWGLTQEGALGGIMLVDIASSGMGYYVTKGFFDTIPRSLDEAARVDGATRLQVLYKVILPMSGPIIVYVVLTAFMGPWADYIMASYIAFKEPLTYNVAVGLYEWLDKDSIGSMFTIFCAGGVLVAIPVTILFMALQRFYVEGVTGGAVKG
ncbi:MAG: sugar ABC transporter permease [Coprobacillus sp.]|nr:sugar ABC transporter permease [Coprobacillus sp.]